MEQIMDLAFADGTYSHDEWGNQVCTETTGKCQEQCRNCCNENMNQSKPSPSTQNMNVK